MKKLILLTATVAMVGCVSATVTEPNACDTVTLGSLPASPVAGITLPPTTFTDQFDFSGIVQKVMDVSNGVTADVHQLTMNNNGDLDWVSEVDVSISNTEGGGSMSPPLPFAQYKSNGTTPGQVVSLNILMDSTTIFQMLENPIVLTFTVQGTAPTQPVNFTNTMCVAVSGSFSKSL